jgi:hypothetical protein
MSNITIVRICINYTKDDSSSIGTIICGIHDNNKIVFHDNDEWFGQLTTDGGTFPFILKKNGIIDYGMKGDDRRYVEHTNIENKEIINGEYLTLFSNDDEGNNVESIYKITNVHKF